MSIWADIHKRSTGSLVRKENLPGVFDKIMAWQDALNYIGKNKEGDIHDLISIMGMFVHQFTLYEYIVVLDNKWTITDRGMSMYDFINITSR